MDEFGKRLLDFRKRAGMSQEELAAKLGISRQTLSKWEQGQSEPDVEMILCLCDVFQITPNELLGTEENGRGQAEQVIRSTEQHIQIAAFDVFMLLLLLSGVALQVVYLCVPNLSSFIALLSLGMMLAAILYFPAKAICAAAKNRNRKA